jgi:hypothetical protein
MEGYRRQPASAVMNITNRSPQPTFGHSSAINGIGSGLA